MWLQLVNGRQGDLVSFHSGLVLFNGTPRLWDGAPAEAGDWVYAALEERATVKIATQESAEVSTPGGWSRDLWISATAEEVAEMGGPTEAWDGFFDQRVEDALVARAKEAAAEAAKAAESRARYQAAQAEAARKDQEACSASGLDGDTWEFRKALRGWDRHYAFSDDSRVWRAGKAEGERLKAWFKKLSDEQKAKLFAYDPECRELARG